MRSGEGLEFEGLEDDDELGEALGAGISECAKRSKEGIRTREKYDRAWLPC